MQIRVGLCMAPIASALQTVQILAQHTQPNSTTASVSIVSFALSGCFRAFALNDGLLRRSSEMKRMRGLALAVRKLDTNTPARLLRRPLAAESGEMFIDMSLSVLFGNQKFRSYGAWELVWVIWSINIWSPWDRRLSQPNYRLLCYRTLKSDRGKVSFVNSAQWFTLKILL
jgi:hypothetical protein